MTMRSFFLATLALVAGAAMGCAPDATTPDGGGGGSGGGGGAALVTYTKDVKPIFSVKCATCHTTDGMGAHNIGTTYADAFKLVMTPDAPAGCFKDGDAKMV